MKLNVLWNVLMIIACSKSSHETEYQYEVEWPWKGTIDWEGCVYQFFIICICQANNYESYLANISVFIYNHMSRAFSKLANKIDKH